MRPTVLALAAASAVAAPAQPPEPERWVRAETGAHTFLVRLAGGPPTQVRLPWEERAEKGELRNIEGDKQPRFGFLLPGGRQFVFHDGWPVARPRWALDRGRPESEPGRGGRLMVADADGTNPRLLLRGLGNYRGFRPAADGTAVFCEAVVGDDWHVFRVPLDGSPPVRMTRTAGRSGVEFHPLPDGRLLYRPVTGAHRENFDDRYTLLTPKGPAVLTDGKAETVLVPEVVGRLPAVTDDGSQLAVTRRNAAGEEVVEVLDVKAGGWRAFRVTAFNPAWPCRFGAVAFSPDGRALAVSFEFSAAARRELLPDDARRASRHVGLIWLDGRRGGPVLYEITDPPGRPLGAGAVQELEWADPPPVRP